MSETHNISGPVSQKPALYPVQPKTSNGVTTSAVILNPPRPIALAQQNPACYPVMLPVTGNGSRTSTTVITVGGCPRCHRGIIKSHYTCCGVLCCILFFPIGLICLFCMKEHRCIKCGACV